MEVTKVLPPGEEQDLDPSVLANLISNAIYSTLRDLKDLSVPQYPKTVFRGDELGIGGYLIPSPSYREEVVRDRVEEIRRSVEPVALTNYIWDRGAMKQTLTGTDSDEDSWKDDWAGFIYDELVYSPLLVALEDSAIEQLVDYGKADTWVVDQEKIEKYIEEIVTLHCEHHEVITAFCPLKGLNLPTGACIEIASDIKLLGWGVRDRCVFMSRHYSEFFWDDFKSPLNVGAIAQVSNSTDMIKGGFLKPHPTVSLVADQLDLLKWGLFLALDCDKPVAEGNCILFGALGKRVGKFRRDENIIGPALYSLDELAASRCTELIQRSRNAMANGPDLKQAIRHFGRACIATLHRDILLESAIGLEFLLVPGPGDSRYRFWLHGSAILSNNNKQNRADLPERLREIYDKRSKAAHGSLASVIERVAFNSRKMLAEAIGVIVALALANKLDLSRGIATAVEQYVIEKATSKTTRST